MRRSVMLGVLAVVAGVGGASASEVRTQLQNPAIDMPEFLAIASQAADYRESHRLSEAEFIRMSREPGVVILDARSRAKYRELHIKGAMNLSFPDITVESLARLIPDKNTKVLIYCNNNFANAEGPFPTKKASASLNLSTYVALYNYGYRNVYELGPLLDIEKTRIEFETLPQQQQAVVQGG